MELKKLVLVVWERKNIFLFILLSVIFLAIIWFYSQPDKYNVVFSVDITRENYQKTQDYRYDQFYRLQADEKFADTIVNWLGDPGVNQKIRKNFEEETSMEDLRAEKLSSNYLRVSFKTKNDRNSLMITNSIKKVLEEKISETNGLAQDPSWFFVLIDDPIVSKREFNFGLIFIGAFLLGFILAVFASLFLYYWQSDENRN